MKLDHQNNSFLYVVMGGEAAHNHIQKSLLFTTFDGQKSLAMRKIDDPFLSKVAALPPPLIVTAFAPFL